MKHSDLGPSVPPVAPGIPVEAADIQAVVEQELASAPFIDVHTHLFMPSLGNLGQWGIDDLVTYHYLEAELFRYCDLRPEDYWVLPKREKADLIWRTLFVENPPVSEATRGVIAVLSALHLPTASLDLKEAREFFAAQKLEEHIGRVFALSGISEVVMTNDPLNPGEASLWEAGPARHPSQLASRVVLSSGSVQFCLTIWTSNSA